VLSTRENGPTKRPNTALQADESGATAIEYALILVLISITVISWATFVGTTISGFFVDIASGF